MLYYLVRPVARYVLRYYFARIDLTGLEHIPRDRPVILAANHPTAFLEPCILACFQPRTLRFLARGNLFRSRWARALLAALHILPVYRRKDGDFAKVRRNHGTLAACYRALGAGRAVMVLAEGHTVQERRLRPLRKVTARLALGALEANPTLREVYVVPVGVNYGAADAVRSTVMIRCGAPLLASDYRDTYRTQPARTIRALTRELEDRLAESVVHFPDPAADDAHELWLEMHRNDCPDGGRGLTHDGTLLDAELAAARALLAPEPLRHYGNRLRHYGIRDRDVVALNRGAPHHPGLAWWLTTALAGLLLLPQLPLWLLAEAIARSQTNYREFFSPVRFAAVAIGTLLYPPALFLLPPGGAVWLLLSLLLVRWAGARGQEFLDWSGRRRARRAGPEVVELRRALVGHRGGGV